MYEYEPLENDEIRVIDLLPGQGEDDIRIAIRHVSLPVQTSTDEHPGKLGVIELDEGLPEGWRTFRTPEGRYFFWDGTKLEPNTYEHPDSELESRLRQAESPLQAMGTQYEALSYVWGPPEPRSTINVLPLQEQEDMPIGVTILKIGPNLDAALRSLRYGDRMRTLWIDAICINQNDLAERGQQVQRMGQIYSDALRVIAYLGPSSPDSPMALDTLRHLGQQIEISDDRMKLRAVDATEPEWWRQDFKLPYVAEQWDSLINFFSRPWWQRLWIVQEITLANPNAVVTCGLETISYYHVRRAVAALFERNGIPVRLREIIYEKREIAYGAKLLNPLELIAYSRKLGCADPRDKIYALLSLFSEQLRQALPPPNYTIAFKQVYQDFFVRYSRLAGRLDFLNQCFPAAADFEAPSWVPDWRSNFGHLTVPLTYGFQAAGHSRAFFEVEEETTLKVTGVRCGLVSRCVYLSGKDGRNAGTTLMKTAPHDMATDTYPSGESKTDAWARTLSLDELRFDLSSDPSAQDTRAHRLARWKVILRKLIDRDKDVDDAIARDTFMETLSRQLIRLMRKNCFFELDTNCIGIGPVDTREGDVLCVLLGCWAPLLLRPSPHKPGGFLLVGLCYAHGLMDSEALLGNLPQGWKINQFLDDGRFTPCYTDRVTGKSQTDDPRLGPLPFGWQRVNAQRSADFPSFVDHFVNAETGETLNSDPRLLPQALEERDVHLETFRLV